ncbi:MULTISPECIES: hypothetical protein [unclassified Streptomyces]|uniref:hypothetical protein n=1 Tax=unclassified Streptomyces TaxID=2593676 RepID=UPI0009405AA9|nr:hypothetical protein [Streptomyces sp. CB02058]OKI97495.1 hypothetical protein AMK10_01255 [Streptomyces sp. CB02058]
MPVIAAVITAVATIAAAVIAAVASDGDGPPGGVGGGPARTVVTAPSTTAESTPSDGPADPPVQTLPATASPTRNAKPRLIAAPDSGAAGDVVTLTASGFEPGEQIRISFRDSGSVEVDLRDVTADAEGRFAAEVRVPAENGSGWDTPTFRVGSQDDPDVDNSADTPFTFTE